VGFYSEKRRNSYRKKKGIKKRERKMSERKVLRIKGRKKKNPKSLMEEKKGI